MISGGSRVAFRQPRCLGSGGFRCLSNAGNAEESAPGEKARRLALFYQRIDLFFALCLPPLASPAAAARRQPCSVGKLLAAGAAGFRRQQHQHPLIDQVDSMP